MQTGLLQCIGAYDILHRNVSSDAVSSLHRGRHRPSGIYVAIKSYKSTSEANQQATLEAQFLTTFRSCRSICTLREILKDDQGTHLIMDWYSKDLGSLIRMHPSGVPADEVLHHSVQILHGLACVHEHQVAYLALKPGKCMLTNQGKSSAIKLIHFNHASQINNQKGSSRRYDTPELLQHCRYDAPELLAGHAWDTAADIWSFGCVLAEMITGQALFPGSCPSMTLSCILNTVGGPPKPLLWTIRQRPALKAVLRDSLAFPLTINESPLAQRLGVLLQNNQPMLQVLLSCLNMDPDKRPTAQQLLEHQAFRESWLNFQRAQMYNSNDNRGSSPAAADSSARKLLALNSVASRVFNQNNGAEDGPRTLLSCPSNVVARSSFSNQEDERKPNPNLKVSALWRAASRNARDGMSDPGYGDGGAAMLMPAPPPAAAGDAPGPSRKFRVNLSVKNAPWQGDTSQMTEEQMKLRGQFEHFAGFGSFKTRASEAGFTPSEADQDRVTPALGGMGGMGGAPLSLLAQNNKSERSVSEPGVWGPISAVPPLGAKPGASGLLQDFNSRLSGSMQNQGPPAEPAPPTEESGINGLSDKLQRMRQAVSMALRASVNARGTFGEGGAAEAAVAAVPAQG